ncbi:TrlF family AAA-like ATPase [Sediminicola luteus]|nr:AAA family ATPase [Sediminicola luteus]
MTNINSQRGSEWRRWDLHIHTPKTKLANAFKDEDEEAIWNKYIDALETSPVQAFGITDYYSFDNYTILIEKYFNRYPKSKKIFFPNIELRFSEAISRSNDNPNVHVIFDNDETNCPHSKISKFLSELKIIGESPTGGKISCSDLEKEDEYKAASINMEALKDALKVTFGDEKPYLIVFPANNDGIRSTDSESPRKVRASDTMDEIADVFFGSSKNKDWFLRNDRYVEGESKPKPVVSGSDAHSFDDLERLEGNVPNFEPTWIKADLTFRGLQQICYEPDVRVFIGSEPPVEARKKQEATKFISNLKIDQIEDYNESNGSWFKGVDIPLNPELIAIIGNKGSGKSALVDILGLLGESNQEQYFSFLSNRTKNKKFKQPGFAENFNAEFQLESGTAISKNLNDFVDKAKPEMVRYLPQNYFEQLTNDIEIEEFRREIEDVVFSHVEQTEKMGKTSFSELQKFKTQQSSQETSVFEANLREINIEIVRLEKEGNPDFKLSLEEKLKAKKAELDALEKLKPKEVDKPEGQTPEQKELTHKIAELNKKIEAINEKEKQTVEIVTKEKNKLQKATSLQQNLSSMNAEFIKQKGALTTVCEELGLDINQIISLKANIEPVTTMISTIKAEIVKYETDNKQSFGSITNFEEVISIPDLRSAFEYVQNEISKLKEQLGTPQRKYQNYLDRLSKWKSNKLAIIGEEENPSPGTIRKLEARLSYINKELASKLDAAYTKRRELSGKIFESMQHVLSFYSELKQSVESKLASVRTDDFSVNIEAAFVLEHFFSKTLLDHINKNKTGSFYGKQGAQDLLRSLLSEVNWNDFNSVYSFIEALIDKLKNHKGKPNDINEQVHNVKDFYDYLFSLSYFSTRYELRLGDKSLNELSPGEKGLLLLVFYLQLDKNNTPLIIDQPEDNLDNESIFTVLASCIREAKKNRQVILVTHNPNLAVGADAEQIIYVRLEKSQNYKFSHETGAIENPRINQKIIDVLEGTQPAFVRRRLKYRIK